MLKHIVDLAKINIATESPPRELGKTVVPVMEVKPMPMIQIVRTATADATSANMMTTSTTKKTYLVGAGISVSKDAVNNGTNTRIDAVPEGRASVGVVEIRYEPITALSNLRGDAFFPPMLLEKGSTISIVNSSATASVDISGIVYYYEED